MILTDYYKGVKMTDAKCRFDVESSTSDYEMFESLLINKRGFNIGGHSFNCVERPSKWNGKKTDWAITKGSNNITSIKRPNPKSNVGFGDIKGTKDACIILFNPDFKENGICVIEIFIARGLRNDTNSLWNLFTDGELNHEIELMRNRGLPKL